MSPCPCPCPKHPIGCYGHPHSCGCADIDNIARAKTRLTAAGFHILSPEELQARDDAALERAAAYVEGKDGRIPGSVAFAALVSGNRQPCMSGDARDRLHPPTRRAFDDATASLASAIRSLKGGRS